MNAEWSEEDWRAELKRAEAQRGVMVGPDGKTLVMDATSNPGMTLEEAQAAAYEATRRLWVEVQGAAFRG